MVVAAGQSALTEIQLLTYLLDRFTIRVPLSDAEVETVTRKVLLQKKPTAVADVRSLLDKHAGEVSRQLQGTRIGEFIEDRAVIVDDYPLLPVRRRFWENCFRQIDAAGTQQSAALAAAHHSRCGGQGLRTSSGFGRSGRRTVRCARAGDGQYRRASPRNQRAHHPGRPHRGRARAAHLRSGVPDRQTEAGSRRRHRRSRHQGSPRRSADR